MNVFCVAGTTINSVRLSKVSRQGQVSVSGGTMLDCILFFCAPLRILKTYVEKLDYIALQK